MTSQANDAQPIALIGFGEAAQAFVLGWGADVAARCQAYDIKTDHQDEAVRAAKLADYARCGVKPCASAADALAGAALVFSLVTADQAAAAAQSAAQSITKEALFFDCNSCSPGAKRANAEIIDAAGGRYVDAAVMAPVYPKMHKTPLALSGPHADAGKAAADGLDMVATVTPGPVGASSTIKMVRSIMMKGMEALFLECVLAGRRAGVDDIVLSSLDATYPGFDFKAKAGYMMERVMTHGVRRAAELREVARTVDELGFEGRMSRATADWEQQIGALKEKAETEDYRILADQLLARLFNEEEATNDAKS